MVLNKDELPKISVPANCGNSPRKRLLRDLNTAYARANTEKILSFFADDIIWDVYGDQQYQGIEEVEQYINHLETMKIEEYLIASIITHGKKASVNGKIRLEKTNLAFCEVYTFSSTSKKADIKRIQSYIVILE